MLYTLTPDILATLVKPSKEKTHNFLCLFMVKPRSEMFWKMQCFIFRLYLLSHFKIFHMSQCQHMEGTMYEMRGFLQLLWLKEENLFGLTKSKLSGSLWLSTPTWWKIMLQGYLTISLASNLVGSLFQFFCPLVAFFYFLFFFFKSLAKWSAQSEVWLLFQISGFTSRHGGSLITSLLWHVNLVRDFVLEPGYTNLRMDPEPAGVLHHKAKHRW